MFATIEWIQNFASKNIPDQGNTNTKAFRLQVLRDERNETIECITADSSSSSYNCNTLKEEACIRSLGSIIPTCAKQKMPYFTIANEFLVPKCVCATILPTAITMPLYYDSAEACARQVALYIEYEPLVDQPFIPTRDNMSQPSRLIVSPTQTIQSGVGDCFDLSALLVSFLLGVGYDAYVVHGSAPRWIRIKDESTENISFWIDHLQDSISALQDLELFLESTEKSSVTSLHINRIYSKELLNTTFRSSLKKDQELFHHQDTNYGEHCWVFVRHDIRTSSIDFKNVQGGPYSYFLEPSTGQKFFLDEFCPYKDIYSVWNHRNYWIQTKSEVNHSLHHLLHNFSNMSETDIWTPIFSTKNSPVAATSPTSWIRDLHSMTDEIFKADVAYHPHGQRIINGDYFQVEVFSKCANKQGLAKRVIIYLDSEKRHIQVILEYFWPNNRLDNMQMRVRIPESLAFQEKYFCNNAIGIEKWYEILGRRRVIKFRPYSRTDGLIDRDETYGSVIIDKFQERVDGMCRREIQFKDGGTSEEGSEEMDSGPLSRAVQRITLYYSWDHYQRHNNLPSGDKMIASRSFLLEEKQVVTQFFNEDGGIHRHVTTVSYTSSRRSILETYNNDERSFKKDLSSVLSSIRTFHYEMQEIYKSREKQEIVEY